MSKKRGKGSKPMSPTARHLDLDATVQSTSIVGTFNKPAPAENSQIILRGDECVAAFVAVAERNRRQEALISRLETDNRELATRNKVLSENLATLQKHAQTRTAVAIESEYVRQSKE